MKAVGESLKAIVGGVVHLIGSTVGGLTRTVVFLPDAVSDTTQHILKGGGLVGKLAQHL